MGRSRTSPTQNTAGDAFLADPIDGSGGQPAGTDQPHRSMSPNHDKAACGRRPYRHVGSRCDATTRLWSPTPSRSSCYRAPEMCRYRAPGATTALG
jgi:hypothetical protein